MMTPFQVVMSIAPTLPEKERIEVRKALGMGVPSACDKTGHKLRILSKIAAGWFHPARVKLYCEKCGYVQVETEQ